MCNHLAGENWGGGARPHFDACFVKCGVGGQSLDILRGFRKCTSFLGLFGRKFSQKLPNFLRSHLHRSRNSLLDLLLLMMREESDVRENHRCVCLEKLTFNSCLDNSHKHVVHGESTRSTNGVSSKLLQLARVVLLVWIAAHGAFWKSESLTKFLCLSKPVWRVDFWISVKC